MQEITELDKTIPGIPVKHENMSKVAWDKHDKCNQYCKLDTLWHFVYLNKESNDE